MIVFQGKISNLWILDFKESQLNSIVGNFQFSQFFWIVTPPMHLDLCYDIIMYKCNRVITSWIINSLNILCTFEIMVDNRNFYKVNFFPHIMW